MIQSWTVMKITDYDTMPSVDNIRSSTFPVDGDVTSTVTKWRILPDPLGPMTALKVFKGPIVIWPRYDLKFSTSMWWRTAALRSFIIDECNSQRIKKNKTKPSLN